MKCQGRFKFKSLEEKQGGEFINGKGETIKYNPSKALKVDEITEKGIYERIFKVALDNTEILNGLQNVKPYDDIIIEFDVIISSLSTRLIPVRIVNK